MNPFRKLSGSVRCPPGLEHRLWRRLPALWLWGTLLPALVSLAMRWGVPVGADAAHDRLAQRWDYMLLGLVGFHWAMVLVLALGCVIVRVMKGPAYGADVYPLPGEPMPSFEPDDEAVAEAPSPGGGERRR